jgi:hypothetical protein
VYFGEYQLEKIKQREKERERKIKEGTFNPDQEKTWMKNLT